MSNFGIFISQRFDTYDEDEMSVEAREEKNNNTHTPVPFLLFITINSIIIMLITTTNVIRKNYNTATWQNCITSLSLKTSEASYALRPEPVFIPCFSSISLRVITNVQLHTVQILFSMSFPWQFPECGWSSNLPQWPGIRCNNWVSVIIKRYQLSSAWTGKIYPLIYPHKRGGAFFNYSCSPAPLSERLT